MLVFRKMGLILTNEIAWVAWEARSNSMEIGNRLSISLKEEENKKTCVKIASGRICDCCRQMVRWIASGRPVAQRVTHGVPGN